MIREALLYVRIAFIASIYVYSTILDLKYREISDDTWILSYPVGLSLLALDLVITPTYVMETLLFIALSIVLAITPASLGLYGGGDAKALILLALTLPRYPDTYKPILAYTTPIIPLTCFNNGILLALATSIYTFIMNLRALLRGGRPFSEFANLNLPKIISLYFLCYKVPLREFAVKEHLYPAEEIEDVDGAFARKLRITLNVEYDVKARLEVLEKYRKLEIDGIYVSFGIPLLFFFTLGFLIAPIGDILLSPILSIIYG
ncbi:MAG: A24 family peptidase C-terminal domain-containing protein [Nitrososphaerota archaeon]|nr:prepilin peptidase [Candidatus Bathyarchaeota archaeon]MDW8061164.1 A24 family peptidase C-terminal domain-containing protein [Nitrososphaerota archaeon]